MIVVVVVVVVFHGQFFPGRSGIVFKHNGHSSDAMGDAFGECHGFFPICSMGIEFTYHFQYGIFRYIKLYETVYL